MAMARSGVDENRSYNVENSENEVTSSSGIASGSRERSPQASSSSAPPSDVRDFSTPYDGFRGNGESANQTPEVEYVCTVPQYTPSFIPVSGNFERPLPDVGTVVYASKYTCQEWTKAIVLQVTNINQQEQFLVRFLTSGFEELLSSKQIAYAEVPNVNLSIGTRIIADVYGNSEYVTGEIRDPYYHAGIIGEYLKVSNEHKYLVFFDGGSAQYVHHFKVFVVVRQSLRVWEDCDRSGEDWRDFIRNYLSLYPERYMARFKPGDCIMAEYHGSWYDTQILQVHHSLVFVLIEAEDNRHMEWIYRGSTRLGAVYRREMDRLMRFRGQGPYESNG